MKINSSLTPLAWVMNLRDLWRNRITRASRALSLLSLLAFLGIGLSALGMQHLHAQTKSETWCAPGAPRHAPHAVTGETCPIAGSMGGVKLAIPQHYLLGPMAYKGVDIWNLKSYANRPKQPTFDNEIDDFAIKIRLTNFKPIETRKDWDDYDKLGKTLAIQPSENRWIHVGFDARNFRGKPASVMNFENTVRFWLNDAERGPFNKESNLWGLEQYVSQRQPTTQSDGWRPEFFYDPKTQATFITCKNKFRAVPPHDLLTFCELQFVMPEIKALVGVSNIHVKEDLARWREIEAGIRQVFQSFIVP